MNKSPKFDSVSERIRVDISSAKEIPPLSFYSNRKRIHHEFIVRNGHMAKKSTTTPESISFVFDDDDDDDVEQNQTNKSVNNSIKNGVYRKSNPQKTIHWTLQRRDIIRVPDLPTKHFDLDKKPFEISCSAVRFGLVEFYVESDLILMKNTEFELKLKCAKVDNLNIKLAYTDMISFYFSFQCQPAAAFIEVRPDFAELFARYIPSTDDHGRQFDTMSKDPRRRRIVFCFKSSSPDNEKLSMSSIYYYLKGKSSNLSLSCINGSSAQELYNLCRYGDQSAINSLTNPFIIDSNDLISKTVGLNENKVRFELSHDDLMCLNDGEFLNDNIIDFYLQYIYYEKLSEEDRKRTYLFNSFFYTRLTRKGTDDFVNLSPGERRYNRVKRWLRDVDIFSKDYLIVPINQTAHWYIIIIQHHNNVLTERDLISDDDDDDDNSSKTNESNCPKKKKVSQQTTNTMPIETADETTKKNRFETPAIILFDSLRTGPKNRVAATLREFLQFEYDHKKPLPNGSFERKLFRIDTIPTIDAAVPQQPNYFDCGLYILEYVERYFANRSPTIDFQSATTFANWCDKISIGSSKRKEIFRIINEHIIPKEE